MIMAAGKSQDLQAGGQRGSSTSKASRLKTQEEPMFQFKSKGRKKNRMSQLEGS